jgi:checkpoint serine/threonine-protein kinase
MSAEAFGTLDLAIRWYRQQTRSGLPEGLALIFTLNLLEIVDWLHTVNILHGDLKTDNLLLLLDPHGETPVVLVGGQEVHVGLKLIDFGKSIDLCQFPRGTAFFGRTGSARLWTPEMRRDRPWCHEIDYFGLANVVHCLLFGDYLQGRPEGPPEVRPFRRYWMISVWDDVFHTLLTEYPRDERERRLALLRQRLRQLIESSPRLFQPVSHALRCLFVECR